MATTEPYSFLYINLMAQHKEEMFFLKFDSKFIPECITNKICIYIYMETLPMFVIKQIQCFNTHPIATLFETEFQDFIDDHV